ncbi:MAG TPA: hypothetical protein VMZ92_12140 [Planctomycetota bacterium]|nr:hypothetical protein [Planctomycetota bacterium]
MIGEVVIAALLWIIMAAWAAMLIAEATRKPTPTPRCPCDDGLQPGPMGLCVACLNGPPEHRKREAAMDDLDRETVIAMGRYGGSFIRGIAAAALAADAENFKRLRAAFPDHFESYARMAAYDRAKGER